MSVRMMFSWCLVDFEPHACGGVPETRSSRCCRSVETHSVERHSSPLCKLFYRHFLWFPTHTTTASNMANLAALPCVVPMVQIQTFCWRQDFIVVVLLKRWYVRKEEKYWAGLAGSWRIGFQPSAVVWASPARSTLGGTDFPHRVWFIKAFGSCQIIPPVQNEEGSV